MAALVPDCVDILLVWNSYNRLTAVVISTTKEDVNAQHGDKAVTVPTYAPSIQSVSNSNAGARRLGRYWCGSG